MAELHAFQRAPVAHPRRKEVLPSAVFAMVMFVIVELMMFAGLISAYQVARASAPGGVWPPPGQPRLPVEDTAINTAALLVSGVLLYLAWRRFKVSPPSARGLVLGSVLLGAFFVAAQGNEWVQLIAQGLTFTSSTHGSYFYLIVGMHALHAIIAIVALLVMYVNLLRDRLTATAFGATGVFWAFVVGLWPFLYLRVYL